MLLELLPILSLVPWFDAGALDRDGARWLEGARLEGVLLDGVWTAVLPVLPTIAAGAKYDVRAVVPPGLSGAAGVPAPAEGPRYIWLTTAAAWGMSVFSV